MKPSDCTLIIPASGLSVRFGGEDKLLADFRGQSLAAHAAQTALDTGFASMIAVVPNRSVVLAQIFAARGFDIVKNPNPEHGQVNSIRLGISRCHETVQSVCIMLADMPLVPCSHLKALLKAAPENGVIKTLYEGHTQPPAVFTGTALRRWVKPNSLIDTPETLNATTVLPLETPLGADVDTPADLMRLSNLTL